MPSFTKQHAEDTVAKLKKRPPRGVIGFAVTEKKTGSRSKHRLFQIHYEGQWIADFGINHGSSRNAGHGWIYLTRPDYAVLVAFENAV